MKKTENENQMAVQTSNAAINATIKAVKKTGQQFNALVQTGIEQCIAHAKEYGDCTGAARLVDAMPQTSRRNEVISHFAEYSPIRIVKNSKNGLMKASLRSAEDENFRPFNVDGVKANPWFQRKSVTDREPGMPYDIQQAGDDVIKLSDRIKARAIAANAQETGLNPKTGEVEKRENIRVKDDDRKALLALADALRRVAFDHKDALAALGVNEDDIVGNIAGHGETGEDAPTDETEEAPVRTGTGG